MSKGYKDQILKKSKIDGYDSLSAKEIHHYPGNKGKKFKPEPGRGTGISPLGKLVAKNANRSVIKAERQLAKKTISDDLIN